MVSFHFAALESPSSASERPDPEENPQNGAILALGVSDSGSAGLNRKRKIKTASTKGVFSPVTLLELRG